MRDEKLPTDEKKLKELADKTDNPQLKRAVEKRLDAMKNNREILKTDS